MVLYEKTVKLGDGIHLPPLVSRGQYKHFIPQLLAAVSMGSGKCGMVMFLTWLGLNKSNTLKSWLHFERKCTKPNSNFWDLFHLKVILMLLNSQICYFLLPNSNYLKHTLQTYKLSILSTCQCPFIIVLEMGRIDFPLNCKSVGVSLQLTLAKFIQNSN